MLTGIFNFLLGTFIKLVTVLTQGYNEMAANHNILTNLLLRFQTQQII